MKSGITVYLCDDDCAFINMIRQKIESFFTICGRECEIAVFSDGRSLLEQFKRNFADVVILDIDMPGMTGFETAKSIQETKVDVHIVFITSHEDKVFQSYEFQPFWFVRKRHLEDLDLALPRLLIKIDAESEKERNIVRLIAENQVVEIDINKVIYISSYNHYLYLKGSDKDKMQIRCKISDAETQLRSSYFIRVHNCVIVNCRFISKVNSREIILLTGEKISISRSRAEYVKCEFQKFMRNG